MKIISFIISIAFLSGCSNYPSSYSEDNTVETRIFVEECKTDIPPYVKKPIPSSNGESGREAGVVGAVASSLTKLVVGTGVDLLAQSIGNSGVDRVSLTHVKKNLTLHGSRYGKNLLPECIYIVRGVFAIPVKGKKYHSSYHDRVGDNIYTLSLKEEPDLSVEILPIKTDANSIVFQPLSIFYKRKMRHGNDILTSDDLKLYLGIHPAKFVNNSYSPVAGKNHVLIDLKNLYTKNRKVFSSSNFIDDVYQSGYFAVSTDDTKDGLAIYISIRESKIASEFAKLFSASYKTNDQGLKASLNTALDNSNLFKTEKQILEKRISDVSARETKVATYVKKSNAVNTLIENFRKACADPSFDDRKIENLELELHSNIEHLNLLANQLSASTLDLDKSLECERT